MGVNWYIDKNIINEKYGTAKLVEAIDLLKQNPIVVEKPYTSIKPDNDSPGIIYGTVQFCSTFGSNVCPGVFGYFDMDVTRYYPRYGDYLLNSEYICLPYGSLRHSKNMIFDVFGDEIFIRPNSGKKVFTGFTIHKDDFDFEIKALQHTSHIYLDTLCVISSSKVFGKEYRFFVSDGDIVTYSSYSWNKDEPYTYDAPKEMLDTVIEIANNDFRPADIFVVDMTMYQGKPKIIEINSASSSGLYGCDIFEFVNAMGKSAIREY